MKRKRSWGWPFSRPPEPKRRKKPRPPKVAGTRVPAVVRRIDFQRPHDFHFRVGYNQETLLVFSRCRLIGFTTPLNDGYRSEEMEGYGHNRWLVLQHPDGRLSYISREGLIYIEESKEQDEGTH